MRRVAVFALSGSTGALFSAAAPILALLLLQPTEYGLFSIPYLVYAFGISLQYSIVSEAWARRIAHGAGTATWREYSTALAALSLVVAVATGVITFAVEDLRSSSAVLAGAVFFALFQNGARYFRVAGDAIRRVLLSDVLGIAGFVIGLVAFAQLGEILWIAGAWLAGGVLAVAALGLPVLTWGWGLIGWTRRNHTTIRPLLLDSLLMDVGAIGTPFLLAGLMGPRDFGIYRAVANVAMPVRLLIEPLRPVIGRAAPRRLLSIRVTLVLLVVGVVVAVACYGALVWLVPVLGFELGTLAALVPHALPSALFVAGNLFTSFFYIICRTNATHSRIMVGRFAQTALVVLLPVGGFAIWALAGAIWGFAVSSLFAALVWMLIARSVPRPDEERATSAPDHGHDDNLDDLGGAQPA